MLQEKDRFPSVPSHQPGEGAGPAVEFATAPRVRSLLLCTEEIPRLDKKHD